MTRIFAIAGLAFLIAGCVSPEQRHQAGCAMLLQAGAPNCDRYLREAAEIDKLPPYQARALAIKYAMQACAEVESRAAYADWGDDCRQGIRAGEARLAEMDRRTAEHRREEATRYRERSMTTTNIRQHDDDEIEPARVPQEQNPAPSPAAPTLAHAPTPTVQEQNLPDELTTWRDIHQLAH